MPVVDFAQLKQTTRIEQVVQVLGLVMRQNGAQWRGECPACKSGGPRALAVNTDKNGYFCFADGKGGDLIALYSHVKGVSAKTAAEQIATQTKFLGSPQPVPQAPQRNGFDATAYLAALDPGAEHLAPLGLSRETLTAFRSGYCKSGVNRGRLALALCDSQGNILGFGGRALDSSNMVFPNGLDPATIIFGADHATEDTRLVRDVLDVLHAYEVGESAVCFLTPCIEAQQCEQLAALLDGRKAKLFF